MPESSASMAMARMSSTIRMPKISSAKRCFIMPSSPSALMMIVVEDIESVAPRKMLSIVPQPNARPIQ
jgi:hypothetical protein